MALKSIKFIYDLFTWIDDTYESLMEERNIKDDVWWITTQVIMSIFKYYLSLARSTAAKTFFDSYS